MTPRIRLRSVFPTVLFLAFASAGCGSSNDPSPGAAGGAGQGGSAGVGGVAGAGGMAGAGSDDQLWPACDLAQPAWQRLVSSGHTKQYADELLCLQDAGHSDLRPGSPTVGGHRSYHPGLKQWLALGGTPGGVGRGQRLADTKTRAFFANALGKK